MEVELIYLDLHGRGMIPRILLQMAKIDFKETLVPCENWASEKAKFVEMGIGQLPILIVNGQVFYQTEAIIEWCASQAGIYSDDPLVRMKERMLSETLTEMVKTTGHAAYFKATAMLNKKNDATNPVGGLTADDKKQLMSLSMPESAAGLRIQMKKVERMIQSFEAPNGEYMFGEKVSVADLTCLSMKTYMDDPTYNSFANFNNILAESAPTLLKIAQKIETHPEVIAYFKKYEGKAFTGLGKM